MRARASLPWLRRGRARGQRLGGRPGFSSAARTPAPDPAPACAPAPVPARAPAPAPAPPGPASACSGLEAPGSPRSTAPAPGPARLTPPASASGGRRRPYAPHCAAAAPGARAADVTAQGGPTPGRASLAPLCDNGWRRATATALCGRYEASGPLTAGDTESPWPRGRARAAKGVGFHTLPGAELPPPAPPRPLLPWRRVAGRPGTARRLVCYVTVSPPDVTDGRRRGAFRAWGGGGRGAGGGGLRARGREVSGAGAGRGG